MTVIISYDKKSEVNCPWYKFEEIVHLKQEDYEKQLPEIRKWLEENVRYTVVASGYTICGFYRLLFET